MGEKMFTGENSIEVRNAFAYLRTIELACDARDDRQSVTYIGEVRELILKLARNSGSVETSEIRLSPPSESGPAKVDAS